MINILDKSKCCGCGACSNICPRNAIIMQEDFEGFLYPTIDIDKCVNCNLCNNVCPILTYNNSTQNELELSSYAVRTIDEHALSNSTSGGFITPLAQYVFNNNGIMCAATYDNNFKVVHDFVSDISDLEFFRGSKYVQSDCGKTFKLISEYLKDGKLVLFVGTGCQVAALHSFLKCNYENLILVDLVCKGVSSPKLMRKYVDYQESIYGSKIKKMFFRNKTYGYSNSTMKIVFDNNNIYYKSGLTDFILNPYCKEIASRPSCYNCQFKSKKRISDFTIYDCWHFEQLTGVKDDNNGYTNVIIQSDKALKIFKKISDQIISYKVDTNKSILLDGIMVENSAKPHALRNNFYKDLDNYTLEQLITKYLNIGKKQYFIENIKPILYKIGILRYISKTKKYIKKIILNRTV